jgi:hypothetical protein
LLTLERIAPNATERIAALLEHIAALLERIAALLERIAALLERIAALLEHIAALLTLERRRQRSSGAANGQAESLTATRRR